MSRNDEPISTPEALAVVEMWDRRLKALDEKLRKSGCPVTVVEPSDSAEFEVRFPAKKKAKPRK